MWTIFILKTKTQDQEREIDKSMSPMARLPDMKLVLWLTVFLCFFSSYP